MNVFSLQKSLLALVFVLGLGFNAYAQPSNDACSDAMSMMLSPDEATCVPVMGDTRNTEDATTIMTTPPVCSGSWYADDVWYTFNTGAVVPPTGVVIKANFTGTGDDVSSVGMAIYASCDVSETAISCFSSDDPSENSTLIPPQCLAANTDYLVRVWSGGSPSDNAGTFTICAFAADPLPPSTDVVIWSENFDAGMDDWSTNVIEGDSLDAWMWDATGTYFNAFGGTVNLNSFTASCNGAVGFPAGWYQTGRTGDVANVPPGPPYPQRSAELISPPIDCSNFSAVACKFTSAFRGLNGSGQTNLGSLFSYSLDGGETWSVPEDPSVNLETNTAYNGLDQRFNLSGAGGVADVRIRFTFTGDFYYWILDDILLVEPEADNMRVNPFFAIPTNAIIPAAQVEPIYFMTDIENIGSQPQTNVNLNLTITDATGNEVYSDDFSYGTVEAGTAVENQPMDNTFTPPAEPGVYTGTYTISADNADFDDSDNSQSFSFEVSETLFAKENGATRTLGPAVANWDDGAPHSWAMGNSFHVEIGQNTGDDCLVQICETVSFGISNPADLVGQTLTVWLYKWNNDDNDDIVQESERERIAFNQYAIDGTEGEEAFTVVMPLIDFASGDENEPVWLEDDANYIVMVEYTAPDDQTDLLFEASEGIFDYGAQIFMNLSTDALGLGVGEARFSPVLGLPADGDFSSGVDYDTNGFGRDLVATVRMNTAIFDLCIATAELSDANVLQVYPNPTQDRVNLYLDLVDIAADANVTIVDITGKTVFGQDYQNIKNNTLTFDVSNYANGTYYLYLTTKSGAKVKKFVVQK